MTSIEELKRYIRDIPDFPKKGILFRDITPLLMEGEIFKKAIDILVDSLGMKKIDKIVGIESRGFVLASAIAYRLKTGLILVRKRGKLPYRTISASYGLEYGTDTLEMHEDAITKGMKVIIIDDLLATGGTAKATVELVESLGGTVCNIGFLIELADLKGREQLKGYKIISLIKY